MDAGFARIEKDLGEFMSFTKTHLERHEEMLEVLTSDMQEVKSDMQEVKEGQKIQNKRLDITEETLGRVRRVFDQHPL